MLPKKKKKNYVKATYFLLEFVHSICTYIEQQKKLRRLLYIFPVQSSFEHEPIFQGCKFAQNNKKNICIELDCKVTDKFTQLLAK